MDLDQPWLDSTECEAYERGCARPEELGVPESQDISPIQPAAMW
jgi:hypothetical protein